MTEAEWLACGDPVTMLNAVHRKLDDRSSRLFAVACCRRIWNLLTDEASRSAVDVAERYADGEASLAERTAAHKRAREATGRIRGLDSLRAAQAAGLAVAPRVSVWWVARNTLPDYCADGHRGEEVKRRNAAQSDFIRCLLGNPSQPPAIPSEWLTFTATALAAGIYADRAFDRLPILADAIEEAGCDSADVLAHCRGDGPHVRGCWVVDAVLGKV